MSSLSRYWVQIFCLAVLFVPAVMLGQVPTSDQLPCTLDGTMISSVTSSLNLSKLGCTAVAMICGSTQSMCGPDDAKDSEGNQIAIQKWDGDSGPAALAHASGTVVGRKGSDHGTIVSGAADASPGLLTGKADAGLGTQASGTAGFQSVAAYIEHFVQTNPSGLGAFEVVKASLDGSVTPAKQGSIGTSFDIYLNRVGIDWWPLNHVRCRFPNPQENKCWLGGLRIVSNGETFGIASDVGDPQIVRSGGTGSTPIITDVEFGLERTYEYTVVHRASGAAFVNSTVLERSARVDFSKTVRLYVDSVTPGVTFRAISGHDYSDPMRKRLQITVRTSTTAPQNRPSATMSSQPDFSIISGGAILNWTGAGNLLTSSYPSPTGHNRVTPTWRASGKDHIAADQSAMTLFVLGFNDRALPGANYAVAVAENTGGGKVTGNMIAKPVSQPTVRALVPPGYQLVGGGCKVNWEGPGSAPLPGNLLTASYPEEAGQGRIGARWICEAKDQIQFSPATITAYAVGLRPRLSPEGKPLAPKPEVRITKSTSAVAANPTATAERLHPAFMISGCGGRAVTTSSSIATLAGQATRPGQLLTGIVPVIPTGAQDAPASGCEARAKEHQAAAPGTVTAYAINVLFEQPVFRNLSPTMGTAGDVLTITGDNFIEGMTLEFGGNEIPVNTRHSVSRLTAVVPNGLQPGRYYLRPRIGTLAIEKGFWFQVTN